MTSRRSAIIAASLAGAAVFVTTLWARAGAPAGVYIDDGFYAILGRALATGHGLRYIGWPGAPSPAHYPPGYPLLLALLWRLGGSVDAVSRWGAWLNAGCLAAAAAFVVAALQLRFDLPAWIAAAAAVVGAVATPVLAVSTLLLSEACFLSLVVLALWAADRSAAAPGRIGWAVAAGAFAGSAALVRTIGLSALAAVLLVALLRRRWRPALAAALGGAVVLVPWILASAGRPHGGFGPLEASYGSYLGYLVDGLRSDGPGFVVAVLRKNLATTFGIAAALFSPVRLAGSAWVAALGVVGALAVAAPVLWRRAPAAALFLALYLGIVLVWPYDPSRFLWGIWPLLVGALAVGSAEGLSIVRSGRRPLALVVPLAVVAALAWVGYGRSTIQGLVGRAWEPSQLAGAARAQAVVSWLEAHAGPDDVVASHYDPLIYLYSGRPTVPVAMVRAEDYVHPRDGARDAADLQAILRYYHPRFLVLPGTAAGLAPQLGALLAPDQVAVMPAADLAFGQAVLALSWRAPR